MFKNSCRHSIFSLIFQCRFCAMTPVHGANGTATSSRASSTVVINQKERINGWSCPWHPLQFVAWFFLIAFSVSYFGVFVFYLPKEWQAAGFIVSFDITSQPSFDCSQSVTYTFYHKGYKICGRVIYCLELLKFVALLSLYRFGYFDKLWLIERLMQAPVSNLLHLLLEYTQIHQRISFRRIHVCTMKVHFHLSWISERVINRTALPKNTTLKGINITEPLILNLHISRRFRCPFNMTR